MKHTRSPYLRLLAGLTALMLVLSACGSGGAGGASASGGDDGPTELRFFRVAVTQDPTKDRVLLELQKRTNTKIEFVTAPWDQEATKVNTLLASGEVIDIISLADGGVDYFSYARNGILLPLDDMLKNNKERYFALHTIAYADMYSHLLVDGNAHGVPLICQPGGGWIAGIRKDWLDNVGLGVPKTHEELYEVFRAFRFDDPDGNGVQDTYAMTVAQIFSSWWFLVNTHSRPVGWDIDANGNLYHVETGPGRKEAYRFMKRLYDDDLMNKDVFTIRDRDLDINDFSAGNTGIAFSPMWAKTLEDVKANNPEAEIEIMFPVPHNPAFTDGASTNTTGWYWMINVLPNTCRNPERALDLLEYLHSDEGRMLLSVGIEGIHYEREEGSVFYGINSAEQDKDWDPKDGEGPTGYPLWWGLVSTINGTVDFRSYENDLLSGLQNCSTFVMAEDLAKNPYWEQRKLITTVSAIEQVPVKLEAGSEHSGRLGSIRQEYETRLILEPASEFDAIWDEYVQVMYDNGLQEIWDEAYAWWSGNK